MTLCQNVDVEYLDFVIAYVLANTKRVGRSTILGAARAAVVRWLDSLGRPEQAQKMPELGTNGWYPKKTARLSLSECGASTQHVRGIPPEWLRARPL